MHVCMSLYPWMFYPTYAHASTTKEGTPPHHHEHK